MEILLYLAGQRQIKIALEEFGIKSPGDACIIILGNSAESVKDALIECEGLVGGVPSDEVLMISDKAKFLAICQYFQIGEKEIDAVSASSTELSQYIALVQIVLNRLSLVTLEK